jgi:hypothetical protein
MMIINYGSEVKVKEAGKLSVEGKIHRKRR